MSKLSQHNNRPGIVKGLGRFFLNLIGTSSVYLNQQHIIKIAKTKKSILLKTGSHLGAGVNLNNYYHFLFDLVLPLYSLISKTKPDVLFTIKIDSFTKNIKLLFPTQVKIASTSSHESDNSYEVKLLGMNAKVVYLKKSFLEEFKKDVFLSLEINTLTPSQKILLIERAKPKLELIDSSSKNKNSGGALRRSIVNHNELQLMIESMVKVPFEFHNLQLETLSFQKQMEYFDQAAVVIAQHGAGLANCLWMRSNTVLIELTHHDSFRHFRYISHQKDFSYFMYKTSGAHATIDVHDFSIWLLNNPKLKDFFTEPQS